jgi:cytochrome c oxidase subunit III
MEADKINVKPVKFVLWLFIVSSVMMFAGLTSAYIVRKAEGNWTLFELPVMFYFTTGTIILSSITLHLSYLAAKRFNIPRQKQFLWITLFLGIAFLVGQFNAWQALVAQGIFLTGNPSGSFLYIISGLHGLHIVAGICMLMASLGGAYLGINQVRNIFRMELTSIFWHFIDILWIYLFVFLLLNQQ